MKSWRGGAVSVGGVTSSGPTSSAGRIDAPVARAILGQYKVARDSMETTGATSVDIDLYYGWHEKMHSKDMQLHYAGRPDRVKRSRVSMMI